MQIADRTVAYLHYTLTNDAGEVLDSSQGGEPLAYLHGTGNIIPGLEKALSGRQTGDKLKVTVSPEEGYGASEPGLIQTVPRDAFPADADIQPGMRFLADSDRGQMPVVVTKVDAAEVTVDGNHPLAGLTLHFDVEVANVRDATAEEVLHGHVHGSGGHHHH